MGQYLDVSGGVARLASLMAVGIGIAWVLQSLGFGFAWVLGAAVIFGAGTGLVGASDSVANARVVPVLRKSTRQR